MKIEYHEISFHSVFEHFVKGFKPEEGQSISTWEAFCDPSKEKIVFKLFVSEKPRAKGRKR